MGGGFLSVRLTCFDRGWPWLRDGRRASRGLWGVRVFCEIQIDAGRLAVGHSFIHVEVYRKVAGWVKRNLVQLSSFCWGFGFAGKMQGWAAATRCVRFHAWQAAGPSKGAEKVDPDNMGSKITGAC